MSSTTDAGATTTYTYDGDGNRLSSTNGTTTTSYAWDTNWALPELASESQAGSELRGYTYGTRVLSMLEDGASYYFHTDRLGSIAAVTSASGQTESQYSYDPFGNLRTSSQAAGAPTNPLGFVGQLQDPATGLYDMRARMYDPTLGRFTATDPKPAGTTAPAIEAYDYAGQDPIDGYDLSGLYEESGEVTEGGPAGDEGGTGESWQQAVRDEITSGSEAHLTHSDTEVLGSYKASPSYVEKAKAIGASYFDLGTDVWESLTEGERVAANNHFLNVIADRGNRILLNVPRSQIQGGTSLAHEIQYLTRARGYAWVNQWSLRPGR